MVLTKQRNQIDDIDKQIMTLLIERFALASEVAIIKQVNKIATLDSSRELIILDKIESLDCSVDVKLAIQEIYKTMMNESKRIQENTRK